MPFDCLSVLLKVFFLGLKPKGNPTFVRGAASAGRPLEAGLAPLAPHAPHRGRAAGRRPRRRRRVGAGLRRAAERLEPSESGGAAEAEALQRSAGRKRRAHARAPAHGAGGWGWGEGFSNRRTALVLMVLQGNPRKRCQFRGPLFGEHTTKLGK